MIKAVIFDCFGVLIDPIYESFIQSVSPGTAEKIKKSDQAADSGRINDEIRRAEIIKLLDDEGIKGEDALTRAYQTARYNQPLLDYILELKSHCKTGLLSNVSDNIWQIFSKQQLDEYFYDSVLSFQVGITKPQPEIYHLSAERLGLQPGECVFVDDKTMNIEAANSVGMQGILYSEFERFKQDLKLIIEAENA